MTKEHYNLLLPILKKYRHKNKDMDIQFKEDKFIVRVGTKRIKYKAVRAVLVAEEPCESGWIYYDICMSGVAKGVSVVNVYSALSVLMDILLDFTIELNKHYRNEGTDESI